VMQRRSAYRPSPIEADNVAIVIAP